MANEPEQANTLVNFNYATMTGFKKYAISYFRDNPELYCNE